MGRPLDKHVDEHELDALVPSCVNEGEGLDIPRPASMRDAERHLASCSECRRKVAQYRQILERVNAADAGTRGAGHRHRRLPGRLPVPRVVSSSRVSRP